MASIVLGSAVSGLIGPSLFGSVVAGQVANAALSTAAGVVGRQIDNALFGVPSAPRITGPRLADLAVQTSTYGEVIPVIYGHVRVAGNIIWSLPIKETAVTTTTSAGGKGGGGVSQSQTSFQYSVTLAIAICEGEIDDVLRVWADSKLIDPSAFSNSYRLYKGTEDQEVDPTIEAVEGVGTTPAYRGMAYVVIEDFPLADFGNRIPNFTFEVRRVNALVDEESSEERVEDMITAMIMIPGSGEFVYDTKIQSKVPGEEVDSEWVQAGVKERINQHNQASKADALVGLDRLLETCPNLEWVGLVVTWFGDSLDAGDCVILPGVEYEIGAMTEPDEWSSAGFTRDTAHLISFDENDRPVYGGTPNDAGVLRYLTELQSRGIKVMFYPMFFMDVENKPWRGRVTGSPTDVASFFTKTNGYNAFITHYANLVKDKVDAFVIGSELIGLTKVNDGSNNFPAVDELVSLAATVKGIVGSGVKVTYAADWSEYHHTDGGWYNLDPLWASANIDMIGIDAYFPLTDEPQQGYDVQKVIDGWTEGEGYDFFYSDPERTVQAPLSAPYAWKNIEWFWENEHVNPDASTTAWVPESKPIWFTEYGFPSVDGATNQPNVFYDPNSSESFFPYHSRGRVDFRAQRTGLTGTELKWKDSTMITEKFVWTWDARPFPFWPDLLNIWSDGILWKTGHWVQGKLGLSTLATIVADISKRCGLEESDMDVTRLTDVVEGYVLNRQTTGRAAIEQLQQGYFFDAVESDNLIKFVPRGGVSTASIAESEVISAKDGDLLNITRMQDLVLPKKVDVTYINRSFAYQVGNQHSQRQTVQSQEQQTINLPIVLPDQMAKNIADVTLFNAWMERTRYHFSTTSRYMALEPTDVVSVTVGNVTHTMRITDMAVGAPGVVEIQAVAEDVSVYDFYNAPGESTTGTTLVNSVPQTRLEILDIPALPTDVEGQGAIRFAAAGLEEGWKGSVIHRSDDAGTSYQAIANIGEAAAIGNSNTALADGSPHVFDRVSSVIVSLIQGELESVTESAVLNGANLAKLGDELFQFTTATLVAPGKYSLSGLLRGRLGTEYATSGHSAGEAFTLIDSRLSKLVMPNSLIGLSRHYKPVSIGATLGSTTEQTFTYQGNTLKPYAPVHVTATRDGSDNITLNWVRRTRVGGDWRDGVDVPLGEASERYDVEILDSGAVVRTFSNVTSQQQAYSAAEQTSDFGSPQSSVDVKIYQRSEIVGRGHAAVGVV